MTYENLLDHLESMTEEQLKMRVCLLFDNQWVWPEVITTVNTDFTDLSDEDAEMKLHTGQVVLV